MTKARDLGDNAQNTKPKVVDAKGDLIVGTGSDAANRLAAGSNGDTLVADSSASTGLRWQGNYAAGKNAIINGDLRINQRAFTSVTTNGTYCFDRWMAILTAGGGTVTYTPETFTAGTAPVAGYEAINYLRIVTASQTGVDSRGAVEQRIEDVRAFAGQTITVSFWAKAGSGTPNIIATATQVFGSGGSSDVVTAPTKKAISTSWARYSFTVSVPSISGKTIGTGSYLRIRIWVSAGSNHDSVTDSLGIQNGTFDIWGVQAESGSVPTPFQTATGTLAGELAACQRYYIRFIGNGGNDILSGLGWAPQTTNAHILFPFPVEMRTAPSGIESNTVELTDLVNEISVGTLTLSGNSTTFSGQVNCATSGLTQMRPYVIRNDNNAAGYVAFTAEL